MRLRTVDVIILLVLGLLCTARATWGVVKDININLSESRSVTGRVVYADIIQIEKATFKSNQSKTVFALKLENSNQNFAIDRGVSYCNYLNSQIKTGDTVKLRYRLSTNEHNTFVFQIEKNRRVLADFNNYKSKETEMIILLYTFGLIILGGLAFWYANENKRARLKQP